jgi:hypothetical protein
MRPRFRYAVLEPPTLMVMGSGLAVCVDDEKT